MKHLNKKDIEFKIRELKRQLKKINEREISLEHVYWATLALGGGTKAREIEEQRTMLNLEAETIKTQIAEYRNMILH